MPAKFSHSLISEISDGMMTRAPARDTLRWNDGTGISWDRTQWRPLKFQTNITDMRMGLAGPSSIAPHLEPCDPPLENWFADKFQSKFSQELFAGSSERQFAFSGAPMESPYLLNSLGTSSLDPLALQQSMRLRDATGLGILPGLNVGSTEPTSSNPIAYYNSCQNLSKSKGKEEAARCASPKGTLPHWLREAVHAPDPLRGLKKKMSLGPSKDFEGVASKSLLTIMEKILVQPYCTEYKDCPFEPSQVPQLQDFLGLRPISTSLFSK